MFFIELCILYAILSIILYLHPKILHKIKKPVNKIEYITMNQDKISLISHRGGSRES